jgi:hypothetical protein
VPASKPVSASTVVGATSPAPAHTVAAGSSVTGGAAEGDAPAA